MTAQTKTKIKSGLITGIGYAGIMAGFDHSDGQDFRTWRFILNALFFGTFMGLITHYYLKKQRNGNNGNCINDK